MTITKEMDRYPTPAEMARAQMIVDSAPVIGVYASCEWDDLHDDGKVWIATIVREASAASRGREVGRVAECCDAVMGSYSGQVELVPPPHLPRRDGRGICVDACLALEITRLWTAGVHTTGCCCGHGDAPPYIGVAPISAGWMAAAGYSLAGNGDLLAFKPKTGCATAPSSEPAIAEGERLRADIAKLFEIEGNAACAECGAPLFDHDETDTDAAEMFALCAGHRREGAPIYAYRVATTPPTTNDAIPAGMVAREVLDNSWTPYGRRSLTNLTNLLGLADQKPIVVTVINRAYDEIVFLRALSAAPSAPATDKAGDAGGAEGRLTRAREAAASVFEADEQHCIAADIRAGRQDHMSQVQAALAALAPQSKTDRRDSTS